MAFFISCCSFYSMTYPKSDDKEEGSLSNWRQRNSCSLRAFQQSSTFFCSLWACLTSVHAKWEILSISNRLCSSEKAELPDLCPGLAPADRALLLAKGNRLQNHSELKVTYPSTGLQTLSSLLMTNKLYRRKMVMIYITHEGQYMQKIKTEQ